MIIRANTAADVRHQKEVLYQHGDTENIINVMMKADGLPLPPSVQAFARQFPPTLEGLKMLYDWVTLNVHYVADPAGWQLVRTPARTLYDREADCKSLSLLIGAVLKVQGIPFYYEFVSYNLFDATPKHVYVVALSVGKEVVLDTVYTTYPATDRQGIADQSQVAALVASSSRNQFGRRKMYYWRTKRNPAA